MRARWIFALALLVPFSAIACGLDDTVVAAGPIGSGTGDAGGRDATVGSDGSTSANDGGGDRDGGAPDADGGSIPNPVLVYANTQTELFSFDVASRTLTHLGTFTDCGSNSNQDDLAVDPSGQLYLLQRSDAIYKLATSGACSFREVLSENVGDIDKIGGRTNGTPQVIALHDSNNNTYAVDPSTGTTVEINGDNLPDNGVLDIACAKTGTCWAAFDHSNCGSGSSNSCLYSFPDDGGAATSLGAIGVHPAGLAYANGALYAFDDDGTITNISLSGTPTASTFPINFAGGAVLPAKWFGAGSAP